MRPLLAVAAIVVLMLGSLAAGYGWGSHGKQSAVTSLGKQLALAEVGLATYAEVEHDRAVRNPLVVNDPYRALTPYASPVRSDAESTSQGVS